MSFKNDTPDFLVPELSGNWRLYCHDGTCYQGTAVRGLQPEDVEANSIRTIGTHLGSLINNSANWLDWSDAIPLVPGMSDIANLRPFDKIVRDLFGHLEAVCMKPKAHLHVEVEPVAVAKARRLPIKSTSYLASHTEDWERPLIRGVLPKRILSELQHDQIDIYENRVVARLVDNISVYLSQRTREIRKLLKIFQDKEDYSDAVGGTYFRQRRILNLWGQSIDTDEGRKRAEVTLKELEWLKYRVMSLMDSPLYLDVPRRTYVAPTLRVTNILTNDQHYRRVAELWRAWVNAGYAAIKSPTDVYQEAQELCQSHDRFALLLVIRALCQLGYEPNEQGWEMPIQSPFQWKIKGHGIQFDCVWEEYGKILIKFGERHLALVAVPLDIRAASSDDQVQTVIDQVADAARTFNTQLIILYAGSSDETHLSISHNSHRRLHTIGNDFYTNLPNPPGFLPISPWDIGSVERIARALRWFLDSARFENYPLNIDVANDARNIGSITTVNGWLTVSNDKSKLTMQRAPHLREWEHLGIEQLVVNAREKRQMALIEYARLSEELKEAVHKRGTLSQQKKIAHQQSDEAERRMNALEKLQGDLLDARGKVKALLVCPTCGTIADCSRDFIPRDECFECSCQECHTRWGTRLCGNGHKYAMMLPGGNFVNTSDSSPGWEDRIYGSDLLALPARSPNGEFGFVCPFCGKIT